MRQEGGAGGADGIHVLTELSCGDLRMGAANDALDLAVLGKPLGLTMSVCGPLSDEFAREAVRRRVGVLAGRSRMLSRRGAALYALDVLRWMLRLVRLRVAVVHVDYAGWGPSLACAAHLLGIPVVGRAGGTYDARNRANQWIDAYVANCQPHAASLLESPLAPKVVVAGSLFRPERLQPPFHLARPVPPKRAGRVRLLFLGQLVERKGIDVLVAAMALVQSDVDALLVGGNWEEDGYPRQLRTAVRELQLEGRVHFENHRPDAPALLDNSDVFVLPSRSDARPRSIIEAMYLGKPVVGTRVGGIPTLIEDGVTGYLVPADDPAALAAAVDRLAGDARLRERLGAAARQWALAEVQPDRAARAYVDLYRRLSASRRGA